MLISFNTARAMCNLSCSLVELGRYHDALALQLEVLDFRRRILPENHPDIGANAICVSLWTV